jgi:hypothetical protein
MCGFQVLLTEDGKGLRQSLASLDYFFTTIFTLELCLNFYAHNFWEFITDGWSCFDAIVVFTSLVRMPHGARVPACRCVQHFLLTTCVIKANAESRHTHIRVPLQMNMVAGEGGAVSVFRLMRVFRVVRLFGRLKAIRQIIGALTASLIPVFNAFFIMFIVTTMFAIMGVNFFDHEAPESFGTLSRALISMFRSKTQISMF